MPYSIIYKDFYKWLYCRKIYLMYYFHIYFSYFSRIIVLFRN
jgi:hypothetical protein